MLTFGVLRLLIEAVSTEDKWWFCSLKFADTAFVVVFHKSSPVAALIDS